MALLTNIRQSIDEITGLTLVTVETMIGLKIVKTSQYAEMYGDLEHINDQRFLAHDIPAEWRKIFVIDYLWTAEDMRFAKSIIARFELHKDSCVHESLIEDIDKEYSHSSAFEELIHYELWHKYFDKEGQGINVLSGLRPRTQTSLENEVD